MKKQYNAPVAEMMEFDYEENVVASNTPKVSDTYTVSGWYGDHGNGKGKENCKKVVAC